MTVEKTRNRETGALVKPEVIIVVVALGVALSLFALLELEGGGVVRAEECRRSCGAPRWREITCTYRHYSMLLP